MREEGERDVEKTGEERYREDIFRGRGGEFEPPS